MTGSRQILHIITLEERTARVQAPSLSQDRLGVRLRGEALQSAMLIQYAIPERIQGICDDNGLVCLHCTLLHRTLIARQ